MTTTTKKSSKPTRSFSTNFFGVVGYVCSTTIWLLVLTCTLLATTVSTSLLSIQRTDATTTVTLLPEAADQSNATMVLTPLASFFLSILLAILMWAFSYVASRIISRVVRRVVGIFHKKVTLESLSKVKYSIHALGVVLLLALLYIMPGLLLTKSFIALIAVLSGVGGLVAIWLQVRLARRHKVPIDRVL
jgi:hypothetical protein